MLSEEWHMLTQEQSLLCSNNSPPPALPNNKQNTTLMSEIQTMVCKITTDYYYCWSWKHCSNHIRLFERIHTLVVKFFQYPPSLRRDVPVILLLWCAWLGQVSTCDPTGPGHLPACYEKYPTQNWNISGIIFLLQFNSDCDCLTSKHSH